MGVELEQKYLVVSEKPWAVQAELLSRLSRAGYTALLLGEKPQSDVYYDTPDDALLRGGGSLRVRRKRAAEVLTVKTPLTVAGGTFARREEELELSPGADPEGFLRGLLPGLDLSELRRTAEVENLRRTYEVRTPGGAEFELAFDDAVYRDPKTGREVRERQVELERVSGTEEDLRQLVEESAGRMEALRPLAESKYQRARRLTAE